MVKIFNKKLHEKIIKQAEDSEYFCLRCPEVYVGYESTFDYFYCETLKKLRFVRVK